MKLILQNGYPYPYPAGLSEKEQEEISEAAGGKAMVIEGVKHFQWLHIISVQFDEAHLGDMQVLTDWKQFGKAVLEAPSSVADGYEHPAIIVKDTAYCGFFLVND